MALYLGLNAVVSASVTLAVLLIWDATHAMPAASLPTASAPVAVVAPSRVASPDTSPSSDTQAAPTVYTVRPGDTLGSIALDYDVPVEDLMRVNGITDPNVLAVDQVLIIPTGEAAAALPAPRPLATVVDLAPLSTPTRAANAAAPQLVIRAVTHPGQLGDEAVEILNAGGPVELAGWALLAAGGDAYRFPSLTLYPNGQIIVNTRKGGDTVIDLYWGRDRAVWSRGVTARLLDPSGSVHSTFIVP